MNPHLPAHNDIEPHRANTRNAQEPSVSEHLGNGCERVFLKEQTAAVN